MRCTGVAAGGFSVFSSIRRPQPGERCRYVAKDMLTDIVSMFVTLAMFGMPMIFFARYLLRRRAGVLGLPPQIRWVCLLLTTIVIGGLFTSAWLIPIIYLLPKDEGAHNEVSAYIASVAVAQMVGTMPVICVLSSFGRRFLSTPSD